MGAAYITGLWTVALPAWHVGELRARAFRTGGRGPGHRAATRERTLSRRGGGAPRTAGAAGRWGRRPASHPGPARGRPESRRWPGPLAGSRGAVGSPPPRTPSRPTPRFRPTPGRRGP